MLDSRTLILLIQESLAMDLLGAQHTTLEEVQVVSATREAIPVVGHVVLPMHIGPAQVDHPLAVVSSLIVPVMLGIDFLQTHGLVLDFIMTPVQVTTHLAPEDSAGDMLKPILEAARKTKAKVCALGTNGEVSEEVIDECAVPLFSKSTPQYDMPQCCTPAFSSVIGEYQELFRTSPGQTNMEEHFISTLGTPVKVPPCQIPASY